ncbi:adenosylmethionine--8-amino-7-oxononanoate transaminase [Myxococcus llanfairpwllgwyngyllgogerychwyrndrobwllllantysiliogogogochensis]|uniref:Adenosylmethionine-8-amino-7-oxononanoate aminotransferase n=1 Tax=Myxococcus llanfairpwllgwyngyllgogerychwyrndrobwllllantysiliogogogochensis TaxID=2590453 RepID=A0A540X7M0_9BACT|nr:adenosylmethionine--8-amino-7-oxononanoate transaminase [Myxococcus llanfairpwllgwyngyllgogerychwyrndrobwllllantysiliogogogochensis]NTX10165.1 adenosylmethionine--8-amino-7-oxononanoate transaminase [Myxococcus sp. CA056]NTX41513.1 adenosylmethionine--8-amino-7-oxononanoate transaminase [Myxococcus sp. CA033]TQF17198.1 adenosylmethionine--8-amino-7-oxononanoate transaminase [Myxococcus llanfairpwllgwyngyllgogerychwyrndrobwllllantysiliogogogochensis]
MERADIVKLDKGHVWHPYTAMEAYIAGTDPLVISRAEGPYLFDVDGRRYLDANGSWWVSTLGHRHPRLLRALTEQAGQLPHVSLAGITHEPAAALASELVAMAPGADRPELPTGERLTRAFYSDNGSTAVEVAIKMTAQYWAQNGQPRRTRFITLSGAFHGETIGSTSVGGVPLFREVFGPLLFDVVHVPSPAEEGGWERAFAQVQAALREHPDEIAGVIVEPIIQGAAGMQMYSPDFLRAVREATRAVDTFLIADEVFTGLGRTGARFAVDLAGVVPDLLCLAKALSGGLMPFAVTLASERIFSGFLGASSRALYYGHSYCGNPLGAAVAREVLAVYRDEDVLGQVARKAPKVKAAFERMAATLPGLVRPRAIGMVGAVDLGGGGYLASSGWRVYEAARRRGLYLRPLGDTVYIAPALNIPDAALDELLAGVEDSLREVARG